jgi:hypothetical protein
MDELLEPIPPAANSRYLPPLFVLVLLLMACLLGAMVGSGLGLLLGKLFGVEVLDAMQLAAGDLTLYERNVIRMVTLVNHLFTFLLPAVGVYLFIFRKEWSRQLLMVKMPSLNLALVGALFMMVSFPLAQFGYWLNKQVPLPESLRSMEDATAGLIKQLLVMNSPAELMLNLLLIAVVPALGEELVFRGILQQHLERWMKRPVAAIWVGAFIFSFIHFQFEGFLPRMLLGAILGYLFYWTRNLWVPILAHLLNNGLQVLVAYFLPEKIDSLDMSQVDNFSGGLTALSLVLCLALGQYLRSQKLQSTIISDSEKQPGHEDFVS